MLFGQHLLWFSAAVDSTVMQQNQPVCIAGCHVQIMKGKKCCYVSLLRISPDQLQYLQLLLHIQIRRRLIHNQNLRFLYDRLCDPDHPSLPAAQRIKRALCQPIQMQQLQYLPCLFNIFLAYLQPQRFHPTKQYDVQHRQRSHKRIFLCHIAHDSRTLSAAHMIPVHIRKKYGSPAVINIKHRLKQGGFSCTICPDQCGNHSAFC